MNKFSPDQNMRRNNLRFLHGLPHIVVSKLWGAYAWDKDFVLKMQGGGLCEGGGEGLCTKGAYLRDTTVVL